MQPSDYAAAPVVAVAVAVVVAACSSIAIAFNAAPIAAKQTSCLFQFHIERDETLLAAELLCLFELVIMCEQYEQRHESEVRVYP